MEEPRERMRQSWILSPHRRSSSLHITIPTVLINNADMALTTPPPPKKPPPWVELLLPSRLPSRLTHRTSRIIVSAPKESAVWLPLLMCCAVDVLCCCCRLPFTSHNSCCCGFFHLHLQIQGVKNVTLLVG
eukprot:scaffold5861_cov98-Skeletonema_dohrnii-CCMP3373.AAC.8